MKPYDITATEQHIIDRIAELERERDEARELLARQDELADPRTHPEQWLGYRFVCRKAQNRWNLIGTKGFHFKCSNCPWQGTVPIQDGKVVCPGCKREFSVAMEEAPK